MYYVWSSHITEYGSTRQGCQSFSWSAEQRENQYSGVFAFTRSRLRICLACEGFGRLVPRQPGYSPYSGNSNETRSLFGYVFIRYRNKVLRTANINNPSTVSFRTEKNQTENFRRRVGASGTEFRKCGVCASQAFNYNRRHAVSVSVDFCVLVPATMST